MSNLLSLMQSVPAVLLADGSFWLPPPDSSTAPAVDCVFYLILGVCAVFFLAGGGDDGLFRGRLSASAGASGGEDGDSQQRAGSHLDGHSRC